MDILDDLGVSKLSAKVFSKVNYSFKRCWCQSQRTVIRPTISLTRDQYFWLTPLRAFMSSQIYSQNRLFQSCIHQTCSPLSRLWLIYLV